MAKPKVSDGVQAAFKAYSDFIDLCRMLFAHKGSDDAAKKINEIIGKDNKFYKEAVALAKECEMSWDNLSPEDSDELQLIMLDDLYNRIKVNDKYKYNVTLNIKPKEEKEAK